ncbi:MAG: hypothetical protein RL219_2405 [Actinomycetota bacterium]|jgi:putative serine protease PepD
MGDSPDSIVTMSADRPNPWMPPGQQLPPPNSPQPTHSPAGSSLNYGEVGSRPLSPPTSGPAGGAPRERGRSLRAAFVGGVVGAVVSAGVAFTTVQLSGENTRTVVVQAPAGTTPTTAPGKVAAPLVTNPETGALELHSLIDKVWPSVVAIEVGQQMDGGMVQALAAGSGVVISADGLILTNAHVVDTSDTAAGQIDKPVYTIKMGDGTVREAKVLGSAPDFDVALMQLSDTSNLTPIELGNSSQVRVGDDVVAIGNALGLGDSPTVTKGIVSALNRSLEESAEITLYGLIQTDAPINQGNSGGALVDSLGRLIGINSAGIPSAQNIGFAIAIDTIKPLLEDLRAGREVTRTPTAFLGVSVSQTPNGVAIVEVTSGTGASKAGVEVGDILKKVGTADISTIEQLGETLRSLPPGTNTSVQVLRDGELKNLTVQLGTRSS